MGQSDAFPCGPALRGTVREVVLPERFDALEFTSDRVWGVQRDELDVASVAWIERQTWALAVVALSTMVPIIRAWLERELR